jgi:hypothetical protein
MLILLLDGSTGLRYVFNLLLLNIEEQVMKLQPSRVEKNNCRFSIPTLAILYAFHLTKKSNFILHFTKILNFISSSISRKIS